MDRTIIYVAGNPDFYPVEYYDVKSQSYQGVIPEFLARFAEEYEYDLRYLQPGTEDRRAELAENQQVDLISGCEKGDRYAHTSEEPVFLFAGGEDGAETAYTLFLTHVSPSRFQSDLREYAARTTQVQWTGALLEAAGEEMPTRLPTGVLAGAALVILALLIALIVSLLRFRREKLRNAQRAQTDAETGLGTVEALADSFSHIIRDQSREFYSLVCIHLELDQIGRMRGYEQAKELLLQGAEVIRQQMERGDVSARGGSDLLVLKRSLDPQQAMRWAGGVLEQLRVTFGESLRSRDAAVGVYPLAGEFCGFDHALFHVRQCAQTACRQGQSERQCCTDQCRNCRERWKLLDNFSKALERGEFQIYLQFFVEARTLRIVGGETLSRWYHPQLGLLNPGRYIPLLEETGQIGKLDFYSLEKTCAFLEELGRHQIQDFFLSCNMARKTICTPDFVQRCIQVVQRYTFPRKLLILEVTENQQMELCEVEQLRQNFQELRKSGIRVIFDDFGVGFTSFRDLQAYPMDGLKLDKELVDNMQTEKGKLILGTLVEIGHRMGLTILAEGVEDEAQIDILRKLHCDVFQGFRFSVPLPETEARERILRGERSLRGGRWEEKEYGHGKG